VRTYERPTLTAAGPFKLTGLTGRGPKDVTGNHGNFL
jgi:hypothetical protein